MDLHSADKGEFAGLMEKISSNEGWIPAYPEFGCSNGSLRDARSRELEERREAAGVRSGARYRHHAVDLFGLRFADRKETEAGLPLL